MSSRLSPAVAATRNALRAAIPPSRAISHRGPGGDRKSGFRASPHSGEADLVLVACSGGADSLALAAAARFVAGRDGWRVGLITIDHQLQPGSADIAASVAAMPGFSPSLVVRVDISRARDAGVGTQGAAREGRFGGLGPEAAAREARYKALAETAHGLGARCVLLGHTQDDQAETVLLALTRGAGPRGLAGMPVSREICGMTFVRPFLGLSRATVRQACVDQGLSIWDDPHNSDPVYTRSRLRAAMLAETLGGDVIPNLARSAEMIGADSSYLDSLAASAYQELEKDALDVGLLAKQANPIRTRILHLWAAALGAPRAALSHKHIAAMDALITGWRGQGAVALPGGVFVRRDSGKLVSYKGTPRGMSHQVPPARDTDASSDR